ncbi:MAG: NUDIX hydrolase [bacterium]
MFVTDQLVAAAIDEYGTPKQVEFSVECTPDDFEFIRSTQKLDRAHDVTLHVLKGDRVIVNAKHFYPQGMFRAPSGGLEPGERFEDGIARELWEETGCRAEIQSFLMIAKVSFLRGETGRIASRELVGSDPDRIDWTSYVFQLRYTTGEFDFTDKHEIREVALVRLEDFGNYAKTMRLSTKGGLHYRAALHEAVAPLLRM